MDTEKEWVRFSATIRVGNRITVPPTVMTALNLKKSDMVDIQARKRESEKVE